MGRKITPKVYAELIQEARRAIPGVAITTDIITGFPGETDTEFIESRDFVRELNFANGHVFTYSPRPGTAAINLPDQIPSKVAKQRNARMRQIFQKGADTFRQKQVGSNLNVLWERATPTEEGQWQLSGLTDNYLRVRGISTSPSRNQIMDVHIMSVEQDGLTGEIAVDTPWGED
jgi:threonylcarbamoyladenosine tRNA methylthiotransferase MtaB